VDGEQLLSLLSSERSEGAAESTVWGYVWCAVCVYVCVKKTEAVVGRMGCLYLAWGSYGLPVNWVSAATRGRTVWREKNTVRKTLWGTFVPAEAYDRGAVNTLSFHLEEANDGMRKRTAERGRYCTCFPKLMRHPQIECKRARGHTYCGKLISLFVALSSMQGRTQTHTNSKSFVFRTLTPTPSNIPPPSSAFQYVSASFLHPCALSCLFPSSTAERLPINEWFIFR